MRMQKRARITSGFTLIELLVAITVMAIVAVLGWRGLDGIVRARLTLNEQLDQSRGLQLAFAQMQSDCAHIASTAILPDRPPIVVEPGKVVIVRTVFTDNQPMRLQIVAYQLKNGVLTRRESPATRDLDALDNMWTTTTSGTAGTPTVALQSGVESLNVRVWVNDGAGWRAPGVDVVTYATAATPIVPTGLEMSLKVAGRSGNLTKVFLLGPV